MYNPLTFGSLHLSGVRLMLTKFFGDLQIFKPVFLLDSPAYQLPFSVTCPGEMKGGWEVVRVLFF